MRPVRVFKILLLILFLVSPPLHAAQEQAGMEQCNSFYHNGEFTKAVDCYEKINNTTHSSSVLFNLGNSYAQLGRTGSAILYYQRALCLAPGDSDIKGNLSLVQNEEGLFPPEPPLIESITDLFTMDQWAILALTALFAYLCFAIYQLKYEHRRSVEIIVIVSCATIFFLGGFGTAMKYQRWSKSVVVSDSKILISPYDNAAQAGTIKQGRLVDIQKQHGKFKYIADETGRKGWVVQENIVSIVPKQ